MIIEIRQRNKFKLTLELEDHKAKNKGLEEEVAKLEGKIKSLQDSLCHTLVDKGSTDLYPLLSFGSFDYEVNVALQEKIMQHVEHITLPNGSDPMKFKLCYCQCFFLLNQFI